MNIDIPLSKRMFKRLYRAALKDNTLTVNDIAYQSKSLSFKQRVVAAFIVKVLSAHVKEVTPSNDIVSALDDSSTKPKV